MKKQDLAFFDLDKTLLTLDSSYVFAKKYYTPYLLFFSLLRKIRFISKTNFYLRLTKHCDSILNNEELNSFTNDLINYKNNEIFDLALEQKSNLSLVVVISSSPHRYVSDLSRKFGFIGFGSYFDENNNFNHLEGVKKFDKIKEKYPPDKYIYRLGVSDNLSDNSFSDKFESWINV